MLGLMRYCRFVVLAGFLTVGWAANAQDDLSGPDAFASIADREKRAAALFEEMGKVLQHPRCLNCHPVDDTPRQGDAMQIHNPPVVRGEADFGAAAMRCNTCHGSENVAYTTGEGSIPGHDPWHLAPKEMGWIGLSLRAICEQIKDPERNGGKTLRDLVEHNARDGLVGWGWEPGEGREPAPGSQEIFGALTQAWVAAGAGCPTD
ncbi:Isoquinoline 1-oxidoreductase subunit [Notoacmeibacter sp. MSK16QG-6]|uniref:Isoquinoline 1-oxidoreductase subunit n=1 Tax=Notoacmeibacter sp. MSK16QG-6 TaxID=2957982 RepID=UPI0020A11E3B|nr:Isoquinoline 1-oxidoreductase subunit [Notoacmeibacter sp. MSK16QG-6]MCP1199629.1 Isoquinoline 1-oxidoreductase subunit [Notoacmeibacter sp. MSK16QG-6]